MPLDSVGSSSTPRSYMDMLQEWQADKDPNGTALRLQEYMEMMRLLNMSFEGGVSLLIDELSERILRFAIHVGNEYNREQSEGKSVDRMRFVLNAKDLYEVLVTHEIAATLVEMMIKAECARPQDVTAARLKVFMSRNDLPEHLLKWAAKFIIPKGEAS